MVLYMYIKLRNMLIYWALSSWKCKGQTPVYWNCHLNAVVWYRPQKKVISKATDTEKRCILWYILIPYLILLAYKGLSYEKVTTNFTQITSSWELYLRYEVMYTSRVHQYLEALVPNEKTIFELKKWSLY